MRYPDGHKASVRARIVAAAARTLKRRGLGGVSIPTLMKASGLTHGGFYVHFRDRDDLVAAAVAHAADETGARVFDGTPDVATMLRAYLSPEHVARPEEGCVLAALGSEAGHQPAPVRKAFAYAARGFVRLVDAKLHPRQAAREPHADALELAARMIGAVVLARLVDDDALAARILAAGRNRATT